MLPQRPRHDASASARRAWLTGAGPHPHVDVDCRRGVASSVPHVREALVFAERTSEPPRILRLPYLEGSRSCRSSTPTEVRQRAVRLVLEQRDEYDTKYAAIRSIGARCSVGTETLRKWVRQAEVDAGRRGG